MPKSQLVPPARAASAKINRDIGARRNVLKNADSDDCVNYVLYNKAYFLLDLNLNY